MPISKLKKKPFFVYSDFDSNVKIKNDLLRKHRSCSNNILKYQKKKKMMKLNSENDFFKIKFWEH